MGLTLFSAASLPIQFWGEAFTTGMHIINELPSPIISNKSPYEMLFNVKPDYATFKTFGCACFTLLRPYNKHKLDFRSACCIFLGYSLHNKGYLCLSSNGKTYVSRHVIFHEEVFPYNLPKYNFTSSASPHTGFAIPTPSLPILKPPTYDLSHNISISSLSPTHITTPSYTTSSHTPSSPISSPSPPPLVPNTKNNHPMVTISKAGILNQKPFTLTYILPFPLLSMRLCYPLTGYKPCVKNILLFYAITLGLLLLFQMVP